jgi:hypothetical protein
MPRGSRTSRARWLLALAGLVLASILLVTPAALAQSTSAPSTTAAPPTTVAQQTKPADPCAKNQTAIARKVCQLGQNASRSVTGAITGAASNIVSAAGDSALRSFTAAVSSAGNWFLQRVGGLINGTTSPNVLNAKWFGSQYRVMLALAVVIALPVLLVSVAQSIVRVDAMQAIRSAFVYLPIAAIFSAVAPAIAQLLIDSSDWMSTAISHNASASAQHFMTQTGSWLGAVGAGTLNPAVPVFGVLMGAIVVVLGAFSIWLELLLRGAAIYIAVLFLPLGFAAMVWPAGWRWCRRLIEFLIAIIFAKVFIVAIIDMAAAGLAAGGLASFEGVLAGGALLLMAAFTPIALLRLIPLAEAAVVTAGQQRAALRQATQGATAFTSTSVVSQMIQSRFRSSGASAAAAGAAGWAAPAAAKAASSSVAAARSRVTSGFNAMTPDVGGSPAPDHAVTRPLPAVPVAPAASSPGSNGSGGAGSGGAGSGGSGGASAGGSGVPRPLKPGLSPAPDGSDA